MNNWKLRLLQAVVWLLVLQGISSLWYFIDVATYGESQKSAADAIAAIFMAEWIHHRIWSG